MYIRINLLFTAAIQRRRPTQHHEENQPTPDAAESSKDRQKKHVHNINRHQPRPQGRCIRQQSQSINHNQSLFIHEAKAPEKMHRHQPRPQGRCIRQRGQSPLKNLAGALICSLHKKSGFLAPAKRN